MMNGEREENEKENMRKVTAIVIGAGQRGFAYSAYSKEYPDELQIVGVAEPRQFQREKLQSKHHIPAENIFTDWKEALAVDKFADCAFITTPDQFHKEPAVAFARKGYHILLEKPMAVTYEDCVEIERVCRESGVILAVCHVLRYSPQARKISALIKSGVIGDVVSIRHHEPIGYYHFAHSFVRGNWRSTDSSTFMLLAKSCHDLDLIQLWMGGRQCTSISSFGSLKHFTAQNKPLDAAPRCLDCGVEATCPYSAKKIYLDRVNKGFIGWPVEVISDVQDIENVTQALRTGSYGRCVYEADNNVVDNQVVSMQYEGGSTVSFSVVAFTEKICVRSTQVFGTMGQLDCDFDDLVVRQFDFLSGKSINHDLSKEMAHLTGGHGGADTACIQAFTRAVSSGNRDLILTDASESLRSHILCFAAEKARLENRVVDLTKEFL